MSKKMSSKIPGVYYEQWSVGASKYMNVVHAKSKCLIVSFTRGPVQRIRDVKKAAEIRLSVVDWNIPKSKITTEHEKAASALRNDFELQNGVLIYTTPNEL